VSKSDSARLPPVYLIAGGRGAARRRGSDPLVAEALALAGVEKPSVAYVGAASGDNAVFRAMISGILKKAGAGDVRLAPLCGKRANPARAQKVLEGADIVFMSGGDVDEGMRVVAKTGIQPLLEELHRAGKPFFGVSAGSIMLARSWVRWTDPEDDGSAELFPCLGIAPVYCDTHGEGDGWEELKVLQGLAPAGALSYGIVSGSALVVRPDGKVSAAGGEIHRFCRKGRTVSQADSLLP
jgi:cyanophycinase-like exopeptidase